ncbi:hypothetical protein CEXT_253791 [Caerostris extrusa]|uniref:Uncharacterized protein n=1 Tax=Caerostris extrusa TaxID=172846 RepID=A0AAV4XE44_CAEEX|nr:hypothetical protein CEXT_253791 [Caerostris extrusa]
MEYYFHLSVKSEKNITAKLESVSKLVEVRHSPETIYMCMNIFYYNTLDHHQVFDTYAMIISAVLRYVTDSVYRVCGENSIGITIWKYPKSTVAYVIKKWKVSGDCRNVPRVGRPDETRPQRADLNLIENLCDSLHRQIQGVHYPSKIGEGTSMSSPKAEWKKNTTASSYKDLWKSMPRRVHAVIASRGGSTNC